MISKIFEIVAHNSVVGVIGLGYVYSLFDFASLPF
jgi:hypothetical protein